MVDYRLPASSREHSVVPAFKDSQKDSSEHETAGCLYEFCVLQMVRIGSSCRVRGLACALCAYIFGDARSRVHSYVCFAHVFKHLRVLPSVHFNLLMTPTYIPAGPGQEKPSAQQ